MELFLKDLILFGQKLILSCLEPSQLVSFKISELLQDSIDIILLIQANSAILEINVLDEAQFLNLPAYFLKVRL